MLVFIFLFVWLAGVVLHFSVTKVNPTDQTFDKKKKHSSFEVHAQTITQCVKYTMYVDGSLYWFGNRSIAHHHRRRHLLSKWLSRTLFGIAFPLQVPQFRLTINGVCQKQSLHRFHFADHTISYSENTYQPIRLDDGLVY